MKVERKILQSVVTGLTDLGIDAHITPPYDSALPNWGTDIEFGDTDLPYGTRYRIEYDDNGVAIIDRWDDGDTVAMASIDPGQVIATTVALCMEVTKR